MKEYPYLFLYCAIGMQIVSIICLYLHTVIFRYNGRGFWLIDVAGHVWLMAGDSCALLTIICLAMGWGTKFIYFPQELINTVLFVGGLTGVRYLWTIYSWYRLGGNEYGGNHIFDGVGGYLEILIGVIKFGVYIKVWLQGHLKQGPIRGIEAKHWRRLDNSLFVAAFIAVVVRSMGIMTLDRYDESIHESMGLAIAIGCNCAILTILTLLMAPPSSPFKVLAAEDANYEPVDSSLDHQHHHHHHHDHDENCENNDHDHKKH